ncbi:MAG: HAD family hydrolase [Deltaproteobacteria bacterium]
MRKTAVLFDMDGVIVDSMPYHFISWYEALRPVGVRVNCIFVYNKEGERWEKTLRELLSRKHRRLSPALVNKVFREKQRIFRKYFKRFIFPGVTELLASLRREGYKIGLVTSTPLAEVRLILPRKIFDAFDAVVTGDMVSRGKPFPDPYLKAARMLGCEPRDCAVVENANLGIRSAKNAGMFCIALTTSLPAEELKGHDVVRDELPEVLEVIRRFAKGKRVSIRK